MICPHIILTHYFIILHTLTEALQSMLIFSCQRLTEFNAYTAGHGQIYWCAKQVSTGIP